MTFAEWRQLQSAHKGPADMTVADWWRRHTAASRKRLILQAGPRATLLHDLIGLVNGQAVVSGVVSTAAAAVNFFKPARAWLDSIWFVTPPVSDVAPKPSDKFTLGGIVKYQIDAGRVPTDSGLTIAIVSAAMVDVYGSSIPIYDSHYRHSGITYGVNEPRVADSALVVNGAAVLHGG